MPDTSYNYTKAINSDQLSDEIRASSIVTALDYINTNGTAVTIYFKAALSQGDQTTLDSIVSNHTPLAYYEPGSALSGSASSAADVISSFLATPFSKIVVQISGTWVGTVQFQGSIDNSTWISVKGMPVGVVSDYTPVSNTTANGTWVVPVTFKYFRVRVSDYTSGTINGEVLSVDNSEQLLAPQLSTPTTPINDHTLQPIGMGKGVINSANYTQSVVLSNHSGDTFTYLSTLTANTQSYICSQDFSVRVPVVGVSGTQITVKSGMGALLGNGSYTLCNAAVIDVQVPVDSPIYEVWGLLFDVNGNGNDDFLVCQVVDTVGVVSPPGTVLKEYDMCWARILLKLVKFFTPDGTPGIIPATVTMRMNYYSSISSGTINVYLDYVVTIKNSF